MKSRIMMGILLALAFVVPTQVHAQYGPCNAQYQGGIPQEKLTMAVVFDATNYTPKNLSGISATIIDGVNSQVSAQYPSSPLTFTEDESNDFNIKVTFHVTAANPNDSSDVYTVIAEVRGLGVGHLFTIVEPAGPIAESMWDVITKLPKYFVNGWHANDGTA